MTPTDLVSVFAYVERFLETPAIALGPLARCARAFDAGGLAGFSETFRRRIGEAALSLDPALGPIVVCCDSAARAEAAVAPLLNAARPSGENAYTFSWRDGEELFTCPYRHDPLLLLPEKSRQEVLDEGVRSGTAAYPLARESRMHCPWCRARYDRALARAAGVWQDLVKDVAVHPIDTPAAGEACPGARVMAANRGADVLPIGDPVEVAGIAATMAGGGRWPRVTGLLFIPATPADLAAWRESADGRSALERCWIVFGEVLDEGENANV